jgi:hypothetical protein
MKKSDIEQIAAFAHGAMAALHGLGALYNIKQNNKIMTVFHVGAAIIDGAAWLEHLHNEKMLKASEDS